MFLTLKIFTKQKRRIGKISIIFRFQCSLSAIPFVLHCNLMQITWLFESKHETNWCKLWRNLMQIAWFFSVISFCNLLYIS